MKILVVDDYEIVRKIHIHNLKKLDLTDVDEAGNGNTALKQVKENSYDLILLDWYMPDLTGLEVLQMIRQDGNQTPIVFCTDEANRDCISKARQEGANDYLTKPYSPSQFQETVKRVLLQNRKG